MKLRTLLLGLNMAMLTHSPAVAETYICNFPQIKSRPAQVACAVRPEEVFVFSEKKKMFPSDRHCMTVSPYQQPTAGEIIGFVINTETKKVKWHQSLVGVAKEKNEMQLKAAARAGDKTKENLHKLKRRVSRQGVLVAYHTLPFEYTTVENITKPNEKSEKKKSMEHIFIIADGRSNIVVRYAEVTDDAYFMRYDITFLKNSRSMMNMRLGSCKLKKETLL